MNDRDDLAQVICDACEDDASDVPYDVRAADAVIAAGWRKKPSRGAVIATLAKEQLLDGYSWSSVEKLYGTQADAVLALLGGPIETEKK